MLACPLRAVFFLKNGARSQHRSHQRHYYHTDFLCIHFHKQKNNLLQKYPRRRNPTIAKSSDFAAEGVAGVVLSWVFPFPDHTCMSSPTTRACLVRPHTHA